MINEESAGIGSQDRHSRGLQALDGFISVLRTSKVNENQRGLLPYSSFQERERARESNTLKAFRKQLANQNDFINIAVHELRAPITPLLMNAEMLQKELGDGNEEVRIIIRNAYRLQYLAQNILDIARIESGTISLELSKFNLTTLISEVLEDHRSFVKRNVQMQFDSRIDVTVKADRNRIAQVLFNILGNAVRFTERGEIETTIEAVGQYAIVIVRDSGPGIDPQVYPHLFSRFAKKSVTGTGMGLGLYISRKIIEAHEGTIMASNNPSPHKGANFSFTLPIVQ
ncbi:MAG TPA: HAMP domain-containing sensor histidine kinase [Nitrososphaerales archaeon]|nr:HAMP domain-containing sensor histidine kinase [Nitrososphaerales archaeon]